MTDDNCKMQELIAPRLPRRTLNSALNDTERQASHARRSQGDTQAGVTRQGSHSSQVLLDPAGLGQEDLQGGAAEEQPPSQRVLGQRALRQLQAGAVAD